MRKYSIIAISFLMFNCSQNKSTETTSKEEQPIDGFNILNPTHNAKYISGDTILLEFQNHKLPIDSLVVSCNNERIASLINAYKYNFNTETTSLGANRISAKAYYENGKTEIKSVNFTLYSNITPHQFKYQVVNVFPHDKKAYTQGLVYKDGILYESTGQWGESSMRKVDIKSGVPSQRIELDDKYFGEGIALYDDKIIQITYKEQTAFIYNQKDLKKIHQFNYPNAEGWGMTYDTTNLIMSDGSHRLFYYSPKDFSVNKVVEVYDNLGPVQRINEMEYVNDKIWANIYGKDIVVQIEPQSGKILGVLNLEGILPESDYHPQIDVLNGIAYNYDKGTYFVTGKNWPKLFEIKILK